MNKSPLRYPGGKSRYIKQILPHIPQDTVVVSPFFGGGHVELACMDRGQEVIGNDAFLPLQNFWWWMKKRPQEVIDWVWEKVEHSDPRDLFYKDRSTLFYDDSLGAAAYFYVNRCSFSGATLSGGFSSCAAKSRFTISSIEKLEALDLSNLLHIYDQDFEFFLDNINPNRFVYADPPYYAVGGLYGKSGDMSFEPEDHHRLFKSLKPFKQWAVSYNDCPEIRRLYDGCNFVELPASRSMSNGKKKCPEILILN
ncbi:DNA adenine methylase [Synechocystis sp. FACHB-383]|uniref:DNA adenine methylase n=1 Tax=Synechocystis sp. FACHB-383 TaxID=2692864 RepID=UPI0016885FC3|nr:DNA adenine methylase [Synechocystis sp. FACHB-383]MBD2653128.1 DNA adenine methylase [Synechocystis sp. FACHB-383]